MTLEFEPTSPQIVPEREVLSSNERFHTAASALAEELVDEAQHPKQSRESGMLWASAGEIYEFGLGNVEKARDCYQQSLLQEITPPSAFSGLRRVSRPEEVSSLGEIYQQEFNQAVSPEQKLRTTLQWALWVMRNGDLEHLNKIDKSLADMVCGDDWSAQIKTLLRQDIALFNGDGESAVEQGQAQLSLVESILLEKTDVDRQEVALRSAVVSMIYRHLVQDEAEAANWLERSFNLFPTENAIRELENLGWGKEKTEDYHQKLQRLLAFTEDSGVRDRVLYEIAAIQTHRLGETDAAINTLLEGLKVSEHGNAFAEPYIGVVRRSGAVDDPDTLVDALGARAETVVSPRERANLLYEMALVFHLEMGLADAAVELLRESLKACPEFRPAARALGRLLQHRGQWDLLAELLEEDLNRDGANWRTRFALSEVYQDRLLSFEEAEKHLRMILGERYYSPAVNRLSRLLFKQERYEELVIHLESSVDGEQDLREKLHLLEWSAEIREKELGDVEQAISCWSRVHELDPLHPGALANLRRLYEQHRKWSELVQLNREEIAVRDDSEAISRLWTESGDVYWQYLNEEESAQKAYEMALDVLPTYEPALEALGRILWRQGDWDGLIDMYKAEIHVLPQGERRTLRLFDLGELQATFANRADEALGTFQLLTRENPDHQDALRWLERLYEKIGRPKEVVNVLEKRMSRVEPEDRASLSLKGATLAEWALSDGPRAWHFYVGALGDPATRAHAVNGLFRLWKQVIEDGDALVSALVELDKAALQEQDTSVIARIHILKSILEKGGRTLTEWDVVRDTMPEDLMTMGACEVLASTRGDVDDLATLRKGTHLGGLWSLISQMDGAQTDQTSDVGWLPDNQVVEQILAELDLNIVHSDLAEVEELSEDYSEQPEKSGAGSLTTFRQLVRAWSEGCHRLQEITEDASIPALRLSTQAALTVGDLAEASRLTELEAGSWSSEESTQRRMTLAAELRHETDVNAARDLFAKSIEVGCYGEPSRIQLYEVLERLGELDLLIEALELHITSLEKDRERRVWLSKLAEVYEQNGDRNGAMASWKEVIERFPKDATAVLEQVRLFCLEKMPEEAAHLIEETLKEKVTKKDRIKLLSRLSEVHIDESLKTERAISALEEACKLSGEKNSWKRRLARVHYRYGDGERGLNLLVESLPSTPSESDLEDWFIMARIKYERLDDKDSAREMLWGLLERFTDNMDTLRELETFYRSVGEASDLAERLTTLLIDQPVVLEEATLAFLWEYVGDLNFQVLKRHRDAQVAFDAAMDSGGEKSALSLKSARAMGRQAGKGLEASRAFSQALRLENIGKEDWCSSVHELESIFEQLEDQARLRVVKQVRDLFEERPFSIASDARVKRDPARTLDMTIALEGLTDGLVAEDSIELIHHVAPIIHHCFKGRRPKKRTLGARRIKGDETVKFMQQVQLSADVLGLKTPKIYEGAVGERPEILNNGSHYIPTKVFTYNSEEEGLLDVNEVVSSIPGNIWSRFWAGQTVGIDAFGWESLGLAEPGEIERLLDAIMSWEQGDKTGLKIQFKKACSGRFKRQRAEIFRLLSEKPHLMDAVAQESWLNLPTYIADRFGLLMTGDVRVAVLAIQYLTSDCCSLPYNERLVTEERTRRLLDFGLSMAYQEIRYHCGLAARPRTV